MSTAARTRWFLAGVGFGVLFVVVVIAMLSCQSSSASGGPMFRPLIPGDTAINLPCAIVLIQVRANTDQTVYWWRIAIIPKVITVPSKPEGGEPEA